jgi:hypothetical protein
MASAIAATATAACVMAVACQSVLNIGSDSMLIQFA